MMGKRKIILGILGIVTLFAIIVALLWGIQSKDSLKEQKESSVTSLMGKYEILSCKSKDDVDSFIDKNKFEYAYEGEYCYIYAVDLFQTSVNVEIYFQGDNVNRISILFSLLEIAYPAENVEDADEDVEFEYIAHEFTEAEKVQAQDAFENVKYFFEEYLECGEFVQYSIVPINFANMEEIPELSEEEQFYRGYTMREYSVKDKEGILWLLDYTASEYSASASINKIVDTAGFEGFIPNIDMTINEEGK